MGQMTVDFQLSAGTYRLFVDVGNGNNLATTAPRRTECSSTSLWGQTTRAHLWTNLANAFLPSVNLERSESAKARLDGSGGNFRGTQLQG